MTRYIREYDTIFWITITRFSSVFFFILRVQEQEGLAGQTSDFKVLRAFSNNDVDEGSLNLFKMGQFYSCVNDKTPSCSDDEANLMPKSK